MEKLPTVEQVRKFLATQQSVRPRFRVPLETNDLEALLTECYALQVTNRGREFILDKATKENISAVVWWLKNSKKHGLLLYGNYGSGKTTMCNAIIALFNAIIATNDDNKKNNGWKFNAAESKIADYISSWIQSPYMITASSIVGIASHNPDQFVEINKRQYLIIDEFGRESVEANNYGTKSEPIIEIIGSRYEKMQTTIMTSNMDDAGIEAKYTRYVSDRFNEMFDKIGYENDSYRK